MTSGALTIRVNPDDERKVRMALEQFSIVVQDRIVKNALRQFARHEAKLIAATQTQYLNPKHMAYRAKLWPSGIAWCGVGYRLPPGTAGADQYTGRAKRAFYDSQGVGWRSHFTELGFHTYPTGGRTRDTGGRGWKRGLRHRGMGGYVRGTGASRRMHQAFGPRVREFLAREISFVREQMIKGKRARRAKIVVEGTA